MAVKVSYSEDKKTILIEIPAEEDPQPSSSGKMIGIANSKGFTEPDMVFKSLPVKYKKKKWKINVYLGFRND